MINLLDDATNQPSKFRTRNWVEKNDESRGAFNDDDDDNNNNDDNNDIKFKTLMIKSCLCDYTNLMHTYLLKEL